jgi:hypothetical protein
LILHGGAGRLARAQQFPQALELNWRRDAGAPLPAEDGSGFSIDDPGEVFHWITMGGLAGPLKDALPSASKRQAMV